jgi:hypothetical protein
MVLCPIGKVELCKSFYVGSNPTKTSYMGVVKWYHYGLQNRSSGFESLHPCNLAR